MAINSLMPGAEFFEISLHFIGFLWVRNGFYERWLLQLFIMLTGACFFFLKNDYHAMRF